MPLLPPSKNCRPLVNPSPTYLPNIMPNLTNDWEFFLAPAFIVDCGTWGIPFGRNGGSWGAIPLGVVLDIGKDMDCGTGGGK